LRDGSIREILPLDKLTPVIACAAINPGKLPFWRTGESETHPGRAIASREIAGFAKMIKGEDGRLLGLHIIGENASEMIQEGTLAIRWGLTSENIVETIHPHPTFSEIIRESALILEGFPFHI